MGRNGAVNISAVREYEWGAAGGEVTVSEVGSPGRKEMAGSWGGG